MPFLPGQPRPMGAGRRRGTPNKDTSEFARLVDELECSPAEILIGLAMGMVVELGYMTVEELEEPGGQDASGMWRKSGRERALECIPAELRAQCAGKLCEFLYPKRKAVEISGEFKALVPVVPIPGLPPPVSVDDHA